MAEPRDAGFCRSEVIPVFTNGCQGNTAGYQTGCEDFPCLFFSGLSDLPSHEDRKTPLRI